MGLRDIAATLPPGFRFYPSDEELVCYYLYKKTTNEEVLKNTLVEIDLHTCEPWQLPEVAKLNANEWYFFSFRDRKYATGFRTNRATTTGYWKATGKDRIVFKPVTREVVGMRKTLVFYRNRAPNGIKTGWIMHEFRLETPYMPPKEDWVLCRVFQKGKEDSNIAKVRPHMLETEDYCAPSSLNLASSSPSKQTDHHHFPRLYENQIASLSSTGATRQSYNQSSLLNLLQFSREPDHEDSTTTQIRLQHDEYGSLWDMDLEENNLENGVASNFVGEMRF